MLRLIRQSAIGEHDPELARDTAGFEGRWERNARINGDQGHRCRTVRATRDAITQGYGGSKAARMSSSLTRAKRASLAAVSAARS